MRKRFIILLAGVLMVLFSANPASAAAAPAAPTYPVSVNVPAGTGVNNLGVFAWSRPGLTDDFSQWINGPVYLTEDNLNWKAGWSEMESPSRLKIWQGTHWVRKMAWGAFPFPEGQGNLGDAAAGKYNPHYYKFGSNLVGAGMDNATIRFGIEFNGDWFPWSPAKDPAGVAAGEKHFADAFRQFVTTMRKVPGQHFKFVWNLALGADWGVNPGNSYPGDEYVDYIGFDIYDVDWKVYPYPKNATPTQIQQARQTAWNNQVSRSWGLQAISNFAAQHNKPMSIPEWGLSLRQSDGHGGGDNPYFIQQMHDWIASHNVAWHVYFNANAPIDDSDIYDTYLFPKASAKFLELWNPLKYVPSVRETTPATFYPRGTAFLELERGTFTPPAQGVSYTRLARPYGDPWASGKMIAMLGGQGAAVQLTKVPAASKLMLRYVAPVNGDTFVSLYVNGSPVAGHLKMAKVDPALRRTYGVLTIPVSVAAGDTIKFQIDAGDDHGKVLLDEVAFVPAPGTPINGVYNLGVFRWDNPTLDDEFSEWIHGPISLVEDGSFYGAKADPNNSSQDPWEYPWAVMVGPERMQKWSTTHWADRMLWGMYPFPQYAQDANKKKANLADAAAGKYNSYYYKFGVNLVASHMSNATIRFGQEFNGNWFPWSPNPELITKVAKDPAAIAADERNFAAAFRQFVTTLRTVPGQHFKFVWNPVLGAEWKVNPANCYPGDEYVDYIGINVYDTNWNTYPYPKDATPAQIEQIQWTAWSHLVYRSWGLKAFSDFADQHRKPMSLPEWGLVISHDGHGGGDNPIFIEQMYNWIKSHNVAWHIYFSVRTAELNHDIYDTHSFGKASAKFQRLWNPTGILPEMRPTYPPTNYPEGTTVIEAETGTFTQPGTPVISDFSGWKLARPYGDPWASSGKLAYLYGQGAAVQYTNVPQASKLMIRYSAGGKRYMSIYVNGTLALAHYELPVVSVPKHWGMATIPVTVPAGATLKFQIDKADDASAFGGVGAVPLDSIGFVP